MALIYEAGLKVSDLAGLTKNDIWPDHDGTRILVKPPKRDPYTIKAPRELFSLIRFFLHEKQRLDPFFEPYLLYNANPFKILPGTLSPRGIELVFEDLRLCLTPEVLFTPRTLRQACVLKWMKQGLSLSLIKEWLGVAPDYDMSLYLRFKELNPDFTSPTFDYLAASTFSGPHQSSHSRFYE